MHAEAACLTPYMEEVMKQLEKDRKHAAVHTYRSTLRSFTEFATGEKVRPAFRRRATLSAGYIPPNLSPSERTIIALNEVFTPGKLKEYETWLRSRNASWNTVSTYMRVLKAVYNRLVAEKRLEYTPTLFDAVYTRVESQTKRALEQEQMNTLLHADFSQLPEDLQNALAYFLLMFLFRGMPFIDLAYLRKQDMKGNCISYCRHKTGRRITVRIPRQAEVLLEEWCNKAPDSGYLFPVLDDTLKKDKELYTCYQKALRNFDRQLSKIASLLLPGIAISSYTARHTWATLAFYAGVSIGIISKALGHSSIKVTETYLRPFENEKVDAANDKLIMSVEKCREEMNIA